MSAEVRNTAVTLRKFCIIKLEGILIRNMYLNMNGKVMRGSNP